MMNSCELVTLISSLSCIIAKDKTADELGILSAVFTQLGDTLATIAVTQSDNCNNSNSNLDNSNLKKII